MDSNQGPPACKAGALNQLSYAPVPTGDVFVPNWDRKGRTILIFTNTLFAKIELTSGDLAQPLNIRLFR
jgi:hypothetical protein